MTGQKRSSETCARIREATLGERNHFFGKVYSAEERARISESLRGKRKSPEHVAKVADAQRGAKRGPLSDETKRKLSAALTGKTRPPEVREKIRLANLGSKSVFWGHTSPPRYGPRGHYNGKTFRSSYEVRFAKALDARGIKWEYEPKRFDLGECTYLPDFYLPDTEEFWEIKGWLNEASQKRIRLFREQHPDTPLVVATNQVIKMFEQAKGV